MFHAEIVTQPSPDFKTLISAANEAMGYSVSEKSDASQRKQTDAEKLLHCLASILEQNPSDHLSPSLLHHASFAVLLICDEYDFYRVLQCCPSMPTVIAPTVFRDTMLAYITGNLSQWRDAVVSGCRLGGEGRMLFNLILGKFEGKNLDLWRDYDKKWTGTTSFMLEDKRK